MSTSKSIIRSFSLKHKWSSGGVLDIEYKAGASIGGRHLVLSGRITASPGESMSDIRDGLRPQTRSPGGSILELDSSEYEAARGDLWKGFIMPIIDDMTKGRHYNKSV